MNVPAALVDPEQAVPPVQVIVMVELPAKPVAVKAAVTETGPVLGLRMSCCVTVNVVVADPPLRSVPEKM